MASLELGLALVIADDPATFERAPWDDILGIATTAEQMRFDNLWIPDELFWRSAEGSDEGMGWWECVAMAGAVAARTSTIGIGTWVLSALHRNPGLTVKAIETIDEISGGRVIFGYGAGHAADQGRTFGYPLDKTVGRYEEALEIVVPLIRSGRADLDGEYHSAVRLINRPRGPQARAIPILLGGHGPRTIGLAARYADIWSAYAQGDSTAAAFVERVGILERACEEIGRDPASIGRSASAVVTPTGATPPEWLGGHLTGPPEQIAEELLRFTDVGITSVELWPWPSTLEAVEALAPVLEIVRAG